MRQKRNQLDEDTIYFLSEVNHAKNAQGKKIFYLVSLGTFLIIFGFLLWANFAVLDEVTRGFGKVIPAQRIQKIQNLEGGILSDIFVTEGQVVKKSSILCRLHNEQAASFYRDSFAHYLDDKAVIARLLAEIDGTDPIFDKELEEKAPQLIADQKRILATNRESHRIETKLLEAQLQQRKQDLIEMTSRKEQLSKSLELATRQRDIAKPLVKRRIHSELDFLHLEQKVLSLQSDIRQIENVIPKAKSIIQEAQGKIEQYNINLKSQALKEINERRQELISIQETLMAGKDKVTRTDVRSPVDGIIKHILLNTLGGVVQAGESIMEIVPLDDTLLVEAEVKPADIAFLHPKQKTMVKITAYDFSIYGGLQGTVEHISADTIKDEKGDNYYLVKVRTTKNSLNYRGETLPIIPGMTAQVDILTGQKSVLDYLLKPILKTKQNALRER